MALLKRLATRRTAISDPVEVRYDPERKISLVLEGGKWVPSFESQSLPGTKKADLEKGEDQKGL